MRLSEFYYFLKPVIPRKWQISLRRWLVLYKRRSCTDVWPIDPQSATPPEGWQGWPEGKQFALVLTHDVDTGRGHDRCLELMHLEMHLGFRSSFNFVPERYQVSSWLREHLVSRGFEVGVHGLLHDGKLYESREIFNSRCARINRYIREWGAAGFRSPSMQHNLEWLHDLDIEYDASTFDTDPFEPQPDGMRTIFPFFLPGNGVRRGYVELPYSLAQDFTLFILMGEKNIEIWKKKLDWIVEHNGMALINVHPDYMSFKGTRLAVDEYDARFYAEFLQYVLTEYEGLFWHALPRDMAHFWACNYSDKIPMPNGETSAAIPFSS